MVSQDAIHPSWCGTHRSITIANVKAEVLCKSGKEVAKADEIKLFFKLFADQASLPSANIQVAGSSYTFIGSESTPEGHVLLKLTSKKGVNYSCAVLISKEIFISIVDTQGAQQLPVIYSALSSAYEEVLAKVSK